MLRTAVLGHVGLQPPQPSWLDKGDRQRDRPHGCEGRDAKDMSRRVCSPYISLSDFTPPRLLVLCSSHSSHSLPPSHSSQQNMILNKLIIVALGCATLCFTAAAVHPVSPARGLTNAQALKNGLPLPRPRSIPRECRGCSQWFRAYTQPRAAL